MSVRDELLTALHQRRGELNSFADRVDELEARVLSFDTFDSFEGPTASSPPRTPPRVESAVPSEGERVAAARQTGQFFKRAVLGQSRGESGRSRVKPQSRIYVVVRDFAGVVSTSPVRVHTQFNSVTAIVAEGGRGNQFGDGIFAGFPSVWEAKAAVSEAGFSWPSSYN